MTGHVSLPEQSTPPRVESPGRGPSCRSWPAPAALRLFLPAAAVLLLAAVFARDGVDLFRVWLADDNYSHGFLIPFVSALLAWRYVRHAGWPTAGQPLPGLALMVLGGFLHLATVVLWFPPLACLALVLLLGGAGILVGGRRWAAGLLFPLLFLAFMFPLPAVLLDRIANFLQGVVAWLACAVLQLFLPAYQQGNVLHLPGERLEVGEACSGLRQLVAFAALALLVVYLSRRSLAFRIALLVGAPVAAVLANLLRVLLMAFLVLQFGPGWIGGALHTAWGLFTLAVGLGLLLAFGWWFSLVVPGSKGRGSRIEDRGSRAALFDPRSSILDPRFSIAAVACLVVTLAAQFALQSHLEAAPGAEPPHLRQPLTVLPTALEGWQAQDVAPTAPDYFAKADASLNRAYALSGRSPGGPCCLLSLVHYRDGTDRNHHPPICYKVAGFTCDPAGEERLACGDQPAAIARFCFHRGRERVHVFYWHYTFEPPDAASATALQRIHQHQGRRLPSLTAGVTTTAQTPEELDRVAQFVQLVDGQLLRDCLPPGTRRGCDTLLIREVNSE
jgi:exosortase